MRDELEPGEYTVLPTSLRDINITGGEPFLRKDLADIVSVIKQACQQARLIISTNGFATGRMKAVLPRIIQVDPKIGLRVSIDAHGKQHDAIRGVKGGYEKCLASLAMARELGVTDLGISMTVLERNIGDIQPLYAFCSDRGLELSITTATESPIYFGEGKLDHAPKDVASLASEFRWLAQQEYVQRRPIRWMRAWHQLRTLEYLESGKRPLSCDAGNGFFYLDSQGNVFACHLQPYHMGNIRQDSWEAIWRGGPAQESRLQASQCDKCWSVCTSRSQIRQSLPAIGFQILTEKLSAHTRHILSEGSSKVHLSERPADLTG